MKILLTLLVAGLVNTDIPHTGDTMTVVYRGPTEMLAVDSAGSRDESDGSRSVIALMMKVKDGGGISRFAGRLAFKCHSHQWRFMSRYLLDGDGAVTASDTKGTPYEEIDPESMAALAFNYVCSNRTTADTGT